MSENEPTTMQVFDAATASGIWYDDEVEGWYEGEMRRTKAETLMVIHGEIEYLINIGLVDGPVAILEHILARHREIEATS